MVLSASIPVLFVRDELRFVQEAYLSTIAIANLSPLFQCDMGG